jgi:hypothetical protein
MHHLLYRASALAVALAIVAIPGVSHAQSGDVPPIAQHEIARRGPHVEQTGTIRSGLMAAALSPPSDDSAKWFLTLVLKPGDKASEQMRSTIANDPAMRPWVDTREPSKSMTHYQVRSVDDATQADWLSSLRAAIQRGGVPLIVLQPPRNGQFGSSSTVVKMISGTLTGDELSRKLREAVIEYVHSIEPRGISQSIIGSTPPFAPMVPQLQPQVPFEFPPPAQVPAPVAPPNPQVPAADPQAPTPWLAQLGIGVAMFLAGLISARIPSWAAARLNAFTAAAIQKAQQNRTDE